MTTNVTIGLLGTGIMGAPMAVRLARAGYVVRVWNRSRDKAAPLETEGVSVCDAPTQAVRSADVVIVMLSSGQVCDDILLGDDAVLDAMTPGSTLIVMSSIPVENARHQADEAEKRGIHYLDAPVSGGEKGAIDGTLAIMVGGEPATFDALRPVLAHLGNPVHVGPAGSGELAKLANQMIVGNTIATVAEALLLAERGGADPIKVREALMGGFADSTILRAHGQRMLDGDFQPGGPAKWQHKDTSTAMALSDSLQLDLPVTRLVDALFQAMVEHGDGDLDHSGLIRELRRRNALLE
ncbi:NAD(P)-dependent oxidoreductase [Halomonas sp. McH1-25]|uniref:NAD(P)-dependent oxidoreductase n=1 Tax=unclassified Halomonas TaxID=2609666 RepID=UPI001EF4636C|nr:MULTISPECIES: NAD(P)-dependent oxidoreductase [unclassified Halomonas]MCG7599913.1 NAD(P)-dependent oxidoreductase [Halomonas sp. McH1-25]MCP1342604.1 NAD(P)-dependent oxidoreductase [Halomonas sp. FL8]MCP1361319.1 NAD(P)-dependent oxidoreductase [Halomonas sp. BBD45]MCP1365061.1 NAD(P)-dependent oxidoreductase [Halomonas sp. BBD48]